MAWIETVVSDDTSESVTLPILILRFVASSRDQSLRVAYCTLSYMGIRRFVVFGKFVALIYEFYQIWYLQYLVNLL